MDNSLMQSALAWGVGLIYSVLIGAFFIERVVSQMWKKIGSGSEARERPWMSGITGMVERSLYTLTLRFGMPGFAAVWLAIKTMGGYAGWHDGGNVGTKGIRSRPVVQTFLVGNGLSVLYGGAGWKMATWIQSGDWAKTGFAAIGLVIATLALELWVRRMKD